MGEDVTIICNTDYSQYSGRHKNSSYAFTVIVSLNGWHLCSQLDKARLWGSSVCTYSRYDVDTKLNPKIIIIRYYVNLRGRYSGEDHHGDYLVRQRPYYKLGIK